MRVFKLIEIDEKGNVQVHPDAKAVSVTAYAQAIMAQSHHG